MEREESGRSRTISSWVFSKRGEGDRSGIDVGMVASLIGLILVCPNGLVAIWIDRPLDGETGPGVPGGVVDAVMEMVGSRARGFLNVRGGESARRRAVLNSFRGGEASSSAAMSGPSEDGGRAGSSTSIASGTGWSSKCMSAGTRSASICINLSFFLDAAPSTTDPSSPRRSGEDEAKPSFEDAEDAVVGRGGDDDRSGGEVERGRLLAEPDVPNSGTVNQAVLCSTPIPSSTAFLFADPSNVPDGGAAFVDAGVSWNGVLVGLCLFGLKRERNPGVVGFDFPGERNTIGSRLPGDVKSNGPAPAPTGVGRWFCDGGDLGDSGMRLRGDVMAGAKADEVGNPDAEEEEVEGLAGDEGRLSDKNFEEDGMRVERVGMRGPAVEVEGKRLAVPDRFIPPPAAVVVAVCPVGRCVFPPGWTDPRTEGGRFPPR